MLSERPGRPFLLAVLAAHNEERFIDWSLRNLIEQGAEVVLIDNDSTDRTRELAEAHLGGGLIRIERLPRPDGLFRWEAILRRKEEVCRELRPHWVMHCDPDELRSPPAGDGTLVESLSRVEGEGANAVNFQEFTFVPTLEHPDHDHPRFAETMHHYYPFLPRRPHRLTLFRPEAIEGWELVPSGGHEVTGENVRPFPVDFPMRHYPVLSAGHLDEKYGSRRFDPAELELGWHHNRVDLTSQRLRLPSESELRDDRCGPLDASRPETSHRIFNEEPAGAITRAAGRPAPGPGTQPPAR